MGISPKKELRKKFFVMHYMFQNTRKNTSRPNNPPKFSICLSIFHISHSHGRKSNRKNIIYNFPKRKRDGVKRSSKFEGQIYDSQKIKDN
ncbi:UNVERIFIED_CONTAM: hypothetical protein NCL1_61704 [Trichonephila clavipes]